VLIFIGLWIRVGILETPVFAEIKSTGKVEKAPVLEVLRKNWREVVLTAFMRTGQMAPFYIFVTYILTYGTQVLGLARSTVLNLVMLSAVTSLFSTPFFGYLSDIVGRRRMIVTGVVVMVFFPFVYFRLIDSGVLGLIALAIIIAYPIHDMQYAPQAAFISETFAGSRRYSGVSLGYQLSSLIAGGPAPIVALYLYETYKTSTAIAAYMSASAVVSLVALWMLKEKKSGSLDTV
jgi:MFS family permease